jgi:2-(3-amino-3-carboxypropyl)histidine synthase
MTETLFIPCRAKIELGIVSDSIINSVKETKIGLISTAQFVLELPRLKKLLEASGKEAIISEGRGNPGQVLGCDAKAAQGDVECFVYLGTGRFHPMRAAYETGKPVYMADPLGGVERLSETDLMRSEKKRHARISKVKSAERLGIIVSPKPGQQRIKQALLLRESLKSDNKKAFIFIANEIKPENFLGFDVDAWINTACPRISEDHFERPIIDISDF